MRECPIGSRLVAIVSSFVLIAALSSAQAQTTGGGRGGGTTGGLPGATTGGNTTGGISPTTTRPTLPGTTGTSTIPDINRPILLSGKVVMEDGTAPPEPVIIQRICSGNPHAQAYTDSKGYFSFQVGQTQDVMPDASESRMSGPGSMGTANSQGVSGNRTNSLFGCDLQASLPGYRSGTVSLSSHRNMDDPNVGTIILHRMSNVEGLTTSATSALAPKDARKAYEKGLDGLKKSKPDDAQREFVKATDLYPKYASAWYELGRTYEQRDHVAEAREAYGKALAADSKYINPYERLYLLSLKEQKWQEVADTTDRILHLNPYDFSSAYFYNAVANLQLDKLDAAEKSAREAVKLDTAVKNPKTNYVLGVILAKKQDFTGSAECLRTYLKSGLDESDKERVAKLLADVEKFAQAKAETKQPEK